MACVTLTVLVPFVFNYLREILLGKVCHPVRRISDQFTVAVRFVGAWGGGLFDADCV
jgi:hypothetical protein